MNSTPSDDMSNDAADRLRRAAAPADAPALSPELVTAAADRTAPRLVNHGRTARAASVSLVAVAAVAAGSLVIANPFAARAPLFTAAASAPTSGAESAALSTDAAVSDSRIGMWINYDYVAGPGLSTSGGNGTVYQLQRSGSPEQVLAEVAAELGLSGEVVESSYFDPAYPNYVIGPEDGSAASIGITWVGTGNWWYNDPTAYPEPVCEMVEYEVIDENGDETTESYEECLVPEVPASESLAPSDAEAQRLAAEFFTAVGVDVTASDITVTSDSWQTMATANLTVDGVRTALDYSIAWSPLGDIAWAYGHSVDVIERGTFDTISATDAVNRLDDWRWYGAAGPDYQGGAVLFAAESGLARDALSSSLGGDTPVSSPDSGTGTSEPGTDEPVEPNPGTPSEEPGSTGEPTEPAEPSEPTEPVEPTDEPIAPEQPIEPMPEPTPETVTVTFDNAEATLVMMWDSNGDAWLVPGYAYEHTDEGWWSTIVSLVDGVIELPEPVDFGVEPMPELID